MAPDGSPMKLLAIAMAICAASLPAATVAKNSPEDYVSSTTRSAPRGGTGPVSWDGEAAWHAAMRAATDCAGLQSSRSPAVVGG
jgi:hypothetical protein